MNRRLHSILVLALFLSIIPLLASGQGKKTITPEEASDYLRQPMTVCGRVVGTKFAETARASQPSSISTGPIPITYSPS